MRVLGSVDARRRSYQAVLRRWRWLTAIVMALALTAGLVVYVTHYGWGSPPAATAGNPVAVHAVQGRKVRVPAMRSYLRRPVLWPAAQTATVTITGTAVRAGSTPVWIGPVQSGSAHTAAARAGQVQVTVAPHRVATGLGVHGIVFAVAPAAGSPPGHLRVSVDYSQFADAYGGGFASRLHLVELPACAMVTPQVPSCRQRKPVVSGAMNDLRVQRVGGDVTLPVQAVASAAWTGGGVLMSAVSLDDRSPGVVLAATASPSGRAVISL